MQVRPVILRDDEQLAGLLRTRRLDLDITQAELDDMIGWQEGYAGKVEAPLRRFGRRVIWGVSKTLFDWMDAVGLRLVLMDRETAEALVAASDAPPLLEAAHTPYSNRRRDQPLVHERVVTTRMVFRSAA
ncbi:hypothetical protein IWC96_14615 [Brevundimonas sp. BAL450]|uniref:hypothetical protein n=1 Tax=Brevundimonas sp. BAL450 TaxID=1708162 RepID=UPI0018C9F3D4|nr:hypothetical protein [Brevundimonas sp. BAL450]MBG7616508.1 hypothetical protein [Brevundimonas sp. BAL450]